MKAEKEKLILFQSTHHSIKAEKACMDNDINYRMAAVPPEISTDCGSAITVSVELDKLKKLFKENNILVEAIYEMSESKSGKKYKKIFTAQKQS